MAHMADGRLRQRKPGPRGVLKTLWSGLADVQIEAAPFARELDIQKIDAVIQRPLEFGNDPEKPLSRSTGTNVFLSAAII